MEAVGFSASILTFVGAAITVSKSIHNTLSAVKDGPEIIAFLSHEISQLGTVLQRLSEVFALTATPADRPDLERLIKKCKNDLVGFEAKLRQLDVSGADGRRGQLWRKLKFCLEEKDLDQIRNVVRGHVNAFTLHLVIIQARQQTMLIDLLPTLQRITQPDILPTLQQIQQGVAAIQLTNASAAITQVGSLGTASRVTELDETQSYISQQAALDDTIARLMKLLEKRPCVMEYEDSKEIYNDLERLLQFVQDEVLDEKRGGGDVDKGEDVSSEVKLFTSLIVSAPSLRINQNELRSSIDAKQSQLAIFQETKRKELHTNDAMITVTTTKRREKLLLIPKDAPANALHGRGFRGSLTLKSKTKKKMVTLSVQQSQRLLDCFTSLLPRVIVCNILPNNSPVFEVVSQGSVEDLMRLIVENKASLDDHDEDGWSLMHHAVGNLSTFNFLIQQGLDVTEIAEDKRGNKGRKTNPLTIADDYDYDISFSEILLHAGADPTMRVEGHPILFENMIYRNNIKARSLLHQVLAISPFAFPATPAHSEDLIYCFCQAWSLVPGGEFNPDQERKTLDLLIRHGYKLQPENEGSSGLHGFFSSRKRSFSKVLERRDLLAYLISRGADPYKVDFAGATPSHQAYGEMCKPCSKFHSSLMGDLWDNIVDIHGYDISRFRQGYPRIASYKNGYTRQIFEQLWSGREERCPYWDDEPWPKLLDQEAELEFESDLGLCAGCRFCLYGSAPCDTCGICLLVFNYLCYEKSDPDHEHHGGCPRSRVGYSEECENCGNLEFRSKIDSHPDSDGGMSGYSDPSQSSDETGLKKVPECSYCRIEETSSDDESVGGAEL